MYWQDVRTRGARTERHQPPNHATLNLSNKSASEVDVSPWGRTKRVCHPHTDGKVMSRAYECAIVGRHSRHIHQVIKDLLK